MLRHFWYIFLFSLLLSACKSDPLNVDVSNVTVDIKFHRLKFNIDPSVFYISGEITTYFVPSVELENIKFDFTDVISVDEVLKNALELMN